MSNNNLAERYAQAHAALEKVDQQHLLTFYDQLDEAQRDALLCQIESQNWPQLAELVESHVKRDPHIDLPEHLEPAPYYPAEPTADLTEKYTEARRLGEHLISSGNVAAFVVAGGQGTRLGWNGPKGTYPATPINNKPLFHVFAEYLHKTQQKYGGLVPWYIMTSPINNAATRAFFEEHDYFGLDADHVFFFEQGTLPSFSLDGRALLASPCKLATNPDGHGGSLLAMARSGALDDMQRRGIKQISYFQVDNPLVRVVDPLFIGLHAMDDAEMSSKMIEKVEPQERVGNFCISDGKIIVIEYCDLPDALAPKMNAGSIAIHVIATSFVQRLNAGGQFALPPHRAVKKVPHIDLSSGRWIEPTEPNAVKLETFVFDALSLAERSIVLETIREEEFGPIKNAEGVDSAVSSRVLQCERAARWLEQAGVAIPRNADGTVDATIELSHLTAIEPEDLRDVDLPKTIERGTSVAR